MHRKKYQGSGYARCVFFFDDDRSWLPKKTHYIIFGSHGESEGVTWQNARGIMGSISDLFRPTFYDGEACDVEINDPLVKNSLWRVGMMLVSSSLNMQI